MRKREQLTRRVKLDSPASGILFCYHDFRSIDRSNILAGKIIEISDLGSVVRLKVDVGKPFAAQITKHSFNEMGLNLNAEVFLTFKASSVQII